MSDATETTDLGMIYAVDLDWHTKRYRVVSTPILKATGKTLTVERCEASDHKARLVVGVDRIAHTPGAAVLAAIEDADMEIARLEVKIAHERGKKAAMERLFEEVRGSMEGLRTTGDDRP